MDLLDQLEQRISGLLADLDRLTSENTSLKEAQARDLDALAEENSRLKEALNNECARNTEALARVEKLVERIREKTDQV